MEEIKVLIVEGAEYTVCVSASNDYVVIVSRYGVEDKCYNIGTNLADVYEFILGDAGCIIGE